MRARRILATVSAAGLVAMAAGLYLAITSGSGLVSWEMTCLGVGTPAAVLAVVVGRHRPHNRIVWLFASAAAQFGLEMLFCGILQNQGSPRIGQQIAAAALELGAGPLTMTWVLLILMFPEGTFLNRGWRWFAIGAALLTAAASLIQWLVSPPGFLPNSVGLHVRGFISGPLTPGASAAGLATGLDVPEAILPMLATVGLIDRYRRSSPVVRQQVKWLLSAVAIAVVFDVIQIAAGPHLRIPLALTLAVAPLPLVSAAVAILRYRLWDIDRLASRTLAFGLLWAASTALFVALAITAGVSAGAPDRRFYGGITLAVLAALLLQPLRTRLEARISTMVYGSEPDGYAALAGLKPALDGSVPIADLPQLVADVALASLGSRWAAVWLRAESDGRQLLSLAAVAGDDPGDIAPDSDNVISVPLIAGDERVGVLASGNHRGETAKDGSLELLALVADQSALVLRNARLENELRVRLQDLRESRQRLVGAQDDERRRLERDLHDGVQQQLVTLAAKLRRFSEGASAVAALADEAEEAVFALQDLGRGIYPGVLADRGLAEALRAHANRVPMTVHVEVEPRLADRRFAREVEAGLYFVALEAITNAFKHAGDTTVTVVLRSDGSAPGLVLEIHDAGDGFDPATSGRGSGLMNMRDRMSAMGGSLQVQSRPGDGTWIRASVPLEAEIVPFQAERVSRR